MWQILQETFIDLLKMLPFLFGSYLLIEYIEHKSSKNFEKTLNKFGPLGGALLGCFPQCGFSVAAANLYAGKVISVGTLIAVFISTSDEAIPILLSNRGNLDIVLKLIVIKIIIAIIAGLLADFILKMYYNNEGITKKEKEHKKHLNFKHNHCENNILKSALKRTFNIFIFIFITSYILHVIISFVGEERMSVILLSDSILQPAIAGIIGFIPNCAVSVILTQLFISGNISFGSIIAGLSTGAGVGLIVLFKDNNDFKQNLKILLYIYTVSIIIGIIVQLLF